MKDASPFERRGMWIILLMVLPMTVLSQITYSFLHTQMTGGAHVQWTVISGLAYVVMLMIFLWRGDKGALWILLILFSLRLVGLAGLLIKTPSADSIWQIWTSMACSIIPLLMLLVPDVECFMKHQRESKT